MSSQPSPDPQLAAKRRVAEAAANLVLDGMRLGLGSGSTAELVVEALAPRVRAGLKLVAVATSRRTAELATAAGIPLADFGTLVELDLAIDGADEVDPALGLVKGHGGALLYEKIVATAAKRFVVVVDASKRVERLGRGAIPLEVVPFARAQVERHMRLMGGEPVLRQGPDGKPFITQAGHLILDVAFGPIAAPQVLAEALDALTGVVEHGLFLGLASQVLVAEPERILTLTRESL